VWQLQKKEGLQRVAAPTTRGRGARRLAGSGWRRTSFGVLLPVGGDTKVQQNAAASSSARATATRA
jgi:hypothetical protein